MGTLNRNNRRTLTMYADTGGSTRRNITIVSHKFLLDRAYARRAEKAVKDSYSARVPILDEEFGRTTE